MSDAEKALPISYRAAALEAAQSLDLVPAKKRKQAASDEAFSLGGGRPSPQGNNTKMDDQVLAYARAAGLDINNKELVDRLKKRYANTKTSAGGVYKTSL